MNIMNFPEDEANSKQHGGVVIVDASTLQLNGGDGGNNNNGTSSAAANGMGNGNGDRGGGGLPVVEANSNNSPRVGSDSDDDASVYRDFATIPAPAMGGAAVHPQSLQAQKLPAKLASMLSDPDLASVITWQPHGRSWRVLNRDLFAENGLPGYFGHKNYASFVRIVNAWGFRRIARGADRDSYYHELFLRGRPDLQQRMKRLANCHRKTPNSKEAKCPNFYDLAKTSPLPEVGFQRGGQGGGQNNGSGSTMPEDNQVVPGRFNNSPPIQMQNQFSSSSLRHGMPGPSVASLMSLREPMGNTTEQMMSMLNNDSMKSMNSSRPSIMDDPQVSMSSIAQLQRDNDELRRRILDLEKNQVRGVGGGSLNHMIPDRFSSLSSNIGQGSGMSRDFFMHSNNNMGSSMNNSLLGGHDTGGSGRGQNDFSSYMSGSSPREEMLLRAMQLENQMGFRSQSTSANSSTMDRVSGSSSSPRGGGSSQGGNDDQKKAIMDWMAARQKQQHGNLP